MLCVCERGRIVSMGKGYFPTLLSVVEVHLSCMLYADQYCSLFGSDWTYEIYIGYSSLLSTSVLSTDPPPPEGCGGPSLFLCKR
jgi:hypothetical protein